MAALGAILTALGRAVGRDLARSFRASNLLFLALLGRSAEALFVVLGLLLLFPLSSDPLGRIPATRLALWPLLRRGRWALRLASLALSPVAWIAVLISLETRSVGTALVFCGVAAGVRFVLALWRRMVKRDRHWDLMRDLPQFPGRLGGLVRKNAREMLSLLDPYAAALLTLGGAAYRLFALHPDPAAFTIIAVLVALAMSTPAQSLFSLDLDSGITRYHLMPVSGWEVLLAKDVAYLAILLALLAPLDLAAGMAFGLGALAVGHHSSVRLSLPQERWRFASGNLPIGAIQIAAGMGCVSLEHQRGLTMLTPIAAAYLASVSYYGRRWERG